MIGRQIGRKERYTGQIIATRCDGLSPRLAFLTEQATFLFRAPLALFHSVPCDHMRPQDFAVSGKFAEDLRIL